MSLNDFAQLTLTGVSINNPTSLQFGPDGRLYVSEQDGRLLALTIARGSTGYSVTNTEVIRIQAVQDGVPVVQNGAPVLVDAVRSMPNHNDDGAPATSVVGRQVTGLLTTTDASGRLVLYVTSSDPRIATGTDSGLDTNSGVISRLTREADGTWTKLDIVRGLPRSEENHAPNGMALGTDANGNPALFVTVGGNTNKGAQGGSFGYTAEYYYSGAIVRVDLNRIAALEAQGASGEGTQHPWLFDLPTLNDPTRPDATETVFGGNDGLNQAKYDPTGTVTIHSSGYRNAYDVIVAADGRMYTFDNSPNRGWGGKPVNAAGELIVDANGDGIPDNGPAVDLGNESGSNAYDDNLHLVTEGSYAGHPNLIRAYGSDAGLYYYERNAQGQWVPIDRPDPVDFDSVNGGFDDPRQAVFLAPVPNNAAGDPFDGSLFTIGASSNGLAEYTAAGDMQGDLLVASWNGFIYRLPRNPDGTIDRDNVEMLGITTKPLDVTVPDANNPFHGTIWVAGFGSDRIRILDPDRSISDQVNASDRDRDGIDDRRDPFAADPTNGTANVLQAGETQFWSFIEGAPYPNDDPSFFDGASGLFDGFDIGFTGLMTDGQRLPEGLFEAGNFIPGGAPGILQVKQVDLGDGRDGALLHGLQFGQSFADGVNRSIVSTLIDNFFDELGEVPAGRDVAQGLFVGTGDQGDYVAVVAARRAGQAGFEVRTAVDGVTSTTFYALPNLTQITEVDTIDLGLRLDETAGTVTPTWTYTTEGKAATHVDLAAAGGGSVAPVQLTGDALAALRGSFQVEGKASALAVGIVSSAGGRGEGAVVRAVNVGGQAYLGTDGVSYAADAGTASGFGASNVTVDGQAIDDPVNVFDYAGTADDALFRDYRSAANLTYTTNVPNGRYELTLRFAEVYHLSPGARQFDVTVEGRSVAQNLDVALVAGPNTAYDLTIPVLVQDGQLNVSLTEDLDKAMLSALVLREAGTFAADWYDLTVAADGATPPPPRAEASITVSKNQPTSGNASTFNANSFVLDNLSAAGVTIERVEIELQNGLLPNLAFDPQYDDPSTSADDGPAGDSGPKDFTRDTGSVGTFAVTASYGTPFQGGFRTLILDLDGFDPGERLAFSIDQDPVSIKGGSPSSANQAGAISGLEQVGANVTIHTSDGRQIRGELYSDGSFAAAEAFIRADLAPAPNVSIVGVTGTETTTSSLSHQVRVTGQAGQRVQVLVTETGAFMVDDNGDGISDNGYAFGPFEGNKVTAVNRFEGTIGANGEVLIPITLTNGAGATDGINVITAAALDGAGRVTSLVSDRRVLKVVEATDTTPPTASGVAADLTAAAATHVAQVTYADASGIAVSTIGVADLTVSGPGAVTVTGVTTQTNANGSVTATYTLASPDGFTSADNGSHTISLAAGAVSDAQGNAVAGGVLDTFSVAISSPPPTGVVAVNAGGPAYTDAGTGLAYGVDTATSPSAFLSPTGTSRVGTRTNAIAGTEADPLYQTERYGKNFGYSVAVANGTYDVELQFAETYFGTAGSRVFDVIIEDVERISNLDIFGLVGKNRAYTTTQRVEVVDGVLQIRFDATGTDDRDNAKITGFVVRPVDGTPPPADTTPPTVAGSAFDLTAAAATHVAQVTYTDASGIALATIDATDLAVSGPGAVTVTGVTTQVAANGSVTATYTLASPGGFTSADNGSHTINLVAGAVTDSRGNAVAGGAVASFAVTVGSGYQTINGTPEADTLSGGLGGDAIYGFAGNDVLNGLAGGDLLEGGAGADRLDGGTGLDIMRGGTGNDLYFVDALGDAVEELAGEGRDSLNSSVSLALPDHVEVLALRTGSNLWGTGNELANTIEGNSGQNHLKGLGGADILQGKGGADILEGGAGADTLTGGTEGDTFFFAGPGDGGDQVTDFVAGVDRIGVGALGFNLSPGNGIAAGGGLDPAWFATGSAATAGHGQFLYDTTTRVLAWDADGTGATGPVALATLNAGVVLQSGDLIVA